MAAALSAKSSTGIAQLRASRPRVASRRPAKVCNAYGKDSRYFDLNDLENTTGAWDMYGQDSDKRYPSLQNEFFERAGQSLSRSEALRGILALCGVGAIVTYGLKGSKDANLPIVKGPLTAGENGKGGTARSRL